MSRKALRGFNTLKPNGNYICHLLQQLIFCLRLLPTAERRIPPSYQDRCFHWNVGHTMYYFSGSHVGYTLDNFVGIFRFNTNGVIIKLNHRIWGSVTPEYLRCVYAETSSGHDIRCSTKRVHVKSYWQKLFESTLSVLSSMRIMVKKCSILIPNWLTGYSVLYIFFCIYSLK